MDFNYPGPPQLAKDCRLLADVTRKIYFLTRYVMTNSTGKVELRDCCIGSDPAIKVEHADFVRTVLQPCSCADAALEFFQYGNITIWLICYWIP